MHGAVRGPKGLNGTPPSGGAAQHAKKPAPDLAAGALRSMRLKMPEQRPEKDGSRIMGDGPPCLDGLRMPTFRASDASEQRAASSAIPSLVRDRE